MSLPLLRRLAAPLAAATLVVACLATGATAGPITTPTLNLYLCKNGFTKTVAAGTDVTFGTNWYAANRGLDNEGVKASEITVTVNGVSLPNTSAAWMPLAPANDGTAAWDAEWRYDFGPATETMNITVSYGFSHPLIDRVVFYPDGSPYRYSGIQTEGSCTIVVS